VKLKLLTLKFEQKRFPAAPIRAAKSHQKVKFLRDFKQIISTKKKRTSKKESLRRSQKQEKRKR